MKPAAYAIKVHVADSKAKSFVFVGQKTMYGGKAIAARDTLFIFDSENEGGAGLIACGTVISSAALPPDPALSRQTPRVSVVIERTARAKRRLGRSELKRFADWNDGRPETELNFKFYRQATNKIVGLSAAAAHFLGSCF